MEAARGVAARLHAYSQASGMRPVAVIPDAPAGTQHVPAMRVASGSTGSDSYAGLAVEAAERFGVSAEFMHATRMQESGGRANARSDTGATGLYQFTSATWNGIVQRHANELRASGVEPIALDRSNRGGSNDPRLEPRANTMAMALLTRDNQRTLGTNDPAALYLAHFSGPQMAKAVMKARASGQGSGNAMALASPELRSQLAGSATNRSVVRGQSADSLYDKAQQMMERGSQRAAEAAARALAVPSSPVQPVPSIAQPNASQSVPRIVSGIEEEPTLRPANTQPVISPFAIPPSPEVKGTTIGGNAPGTALPEAEQRRAERAAVDAAGGSQKVSVSNNVSFEPLNINLTNERTGETQQISHMPQTTVPAARGLGTALA